MAKSLLIKDKFKPGEWIIANNEFAHTECVYGLMHYTLITRHYTFFLLNTEYHPYPCVQCVPSSKN